MEHLESTVTARNANSFRQLFSLARSDTEEAWKFVIQSEILPRPAATCVQLEQLFSCLVSDLLMVMIRAKSVSLLSKHAAKFSTKKAKKKKKESRAEKAES